MRKRKKTKIPNIILLYYSINYQINSLKNQPVNKTTTLTAIDF